MTRRLALVAGIAALAALLAIMSGTALACALSYSWFPS